MIDRRSRLRGVLIARRSVPLIIGVHRAGWLITIGCPRVVTKVRSMFDRGILFNSSRSSDYFSFQRPHGRPLRYFAFFYGVLSFFPCSSSMYWYFNVSRLILPLRPIEWPFTVRSSKVQAYLRDVILLQNFIFPALVDNYVEFPTLSFWLYRTKLFAVCLRSSPFKRKILLLKFTISTSQKSRIFPF